MRFYDELMSDKRCPKLLKDSVKTNTIIDADSVIDYYFQSPQSSWMIGRDIPTIAPPFQEFFVDVSTPPRVINIDGNIVDNSNHDHLHPYGISFSYIDWKAMGYQEKFQFTTDYLRDTLCIKYKMSPAEFVSHANENDIRWVILSLIIMKFPTPGFYLVCSSHVCITLDGTVPGIDFAADDEAPMPFSVFTVPVVELADNEDLRAMYDNGIQETFIKSGEMGGVLNMHFKPALLAISFMHCRNVSLSDAVPSRSQSKKFEKHHAIPLCTYKTINIEPMKTILKTEGRSDHVGIQKALHICRGHFKTYTLDAPLFGKHTGTYYVPMHVRGAAKQGEIIKNYKIKL